MPSFPKMFLRWYSTAFVLTYRLVGHLSVGQTPVLFKDGDRTAAIAELPTEDSVPDEPLVHLD